MQIQLIAQFTERSIVNISRNSLAGLRITNLIIKTGSQARMIGCK